MIAEVHLLYHHLYHHYYPTNKAFHFFTMSNFKMFWSHLMGFYYDVILKVQQPFSEGQNSAD